MNPNRDQQTGERMILVIASCQSCGFNGEVELPWEIGSNLMVTDCPKCLHRKSLTPTSIVPEKEEDEKNVEPEVKEPVTPTSTEAQVIDPTEIPANDNKI